MTGNSAIRKFCGDPQQMRLVLNLEDHGVRTHGNRTAHGGLASGVDDLPSREARRKIGTDNDVVEHCFHARCLRFLRLGRASDWQRVKLVRCSWR